MLEQASNLLEFGNRSHVQTLIMVSFYESRLGTGALIFVPLGLPRGVILVYFTSATDRGERILTSSVYLSSSISTPVIRSSVVTWCARLHSMH